MEILVFQHGSHWHAQWVKEGDGGLVYGDNCGGARTREEAEQWAADMQAEADRTTR